MRHLILYDGACGLCDGLVRFVLGWDAAEQFGFASIQSPYGRLVLAASGEEAPAVDTFYVVANAWSESPTLFAKGRAARFVLTRLDRAFRWTAVVLRVVPTSWLDRAYDLVAAHRYRVWGYRAGCEIPDSRFRDRFIGWDDDGDEPAPPSHSTLAMDGRG